MNRMIVQHVAYGMNAGDIPRMPDNQLIAAFFQADTNLPSIRPEHREGIRRNMAAVADELYDRARKARGKRRTRLTVHWDTMRAIVDKLYEGKP